MMPNQEQGQDEPQDPGAQSVSEYFSRVGRAGVQTATIDDVTSVLEYFGIGAQPAGHAPTPHTIAKDAAAAAATGASSSTAVTTLTPPAAAAAASVDTPSTAQRAEAIACSIVESLAPALAAALLKHL
jgi:hypothetical protein